MTTFSYTWHRSPTFAGRNEYGLPKREYLHYVVATAPDGARWAHFHAEMSPSEECPPATARFLARALDAKPDPRTSEVWDPTDPVEGSPADLLEREDEALIARIEDERFGSDDYLSRSVRWD